MSDSLFDQIMKDADRMRAESFAQSPQITLGQLIDMLERVEDKRKGVCFEFADLPPGDLHSWRGSYDELSIGLTRSPYQADYVTVENWLPILKAAVGQSFTGWKGGEFVMTEDTPVWVAEWGTSGETGLVGICEEEYNVYLLTDRCEY